MEGDPHVGVAEQRRPGVASRNASAHASLDCGGKTNRTATNPRTSRLSFSLESKHGRASATACFVPGSNLFVTSKTFWSETGSLPSATSNAECQSCELRRDTCAQVDFFSASKCHSCRRWTNAMFMPSRESRQKQKSSSRRTPHAQIMARH